jgi:hypothetical protein
VLIVRDLAAGFDADDGTVDQREDAELRAVGAGDA